MDATVVRLGRLEQVGAAMGDPFEHGAHELRPAAATGQPEQRAARAVVPVRRAEAHQRRHVHHAVGVLALRGDVVAVGRGVDDAEVVAQPLDVGARPRA